MLIHFKAKTSIQRLKLVKIRIQRIPKRSGGRLSQNCENLKVSNILTIENKATFKRALLTNIESQFPQKQRGKNIYNCHRKKHQYYNNQYSDIYIYNCTL